MYAKVDRRRLRSRSVAAILVVTATAAAIVVSFAGGATAASKHGNAVKHHSKTTARFENNPKTRDVGGTRDVGFTG
jgi:hypothetical protein